MYLNIELAKLKLFKPKEIFDWLEKEYKNKSLTLNENKIIEEELYKYNDDLINLGLVLYGYNSNVLDEIYLNTLNEDIKLAYLSTSSHIKKTYIIDLVSNYSTLSKQKMLKIMNNTIDELYGINKHNEFEDDEKVFLLYRERLRYLLTNTFINDRVLINLYSQKEYFSDFNENILMELISFTKDNKRLSISYEDKYNDYLDWHLESSYNEVFNSFYKLLEDIDVNDKNASILSSMLDVVNYKGVFNLDLEKCINRWQKDNDVFSSFSYIRYFLAKKFFKENQIKKLKNNKDLALRKAFYGSPYILNHHKNNVIDSYFDQLKNLYEQDGENFVNEVLQNEAMYYNKNRRLALKKFIDLVESKSNKFGLDYLNTYNHEYNINLENNPKWFEDEQEDGFFDPIEDIKDKEIKKEKMIEIIYKNVKLQKDSNLLGQFETTNYKIDNLLSEKYFDNIKAIFDEKLSNISRTKWLFIGILFGIIIMELIYKL